MKGSQLPRDGTQDALASLPFVVVGVTSGAVDSRWLDLCDVTVADGDDALERIEANVAAHPITAVTLALLLRGQRGQRPSVGQGLVAESSAYSVLQSGPEFAAWRAAHLAPSGRRTTVPESGWIGRTIASPSPSHDPVGSTRSTHRCGTRSSKRSRLPLPMLRSHGSSCAARAEPSAPAATSTSSAPGRIRPRHTSFAWSGASPACSIPSRSR